MKSSYFNSTLKSFPAYDFVEFWIDAVPDREDEMLQMLEECRLQLEHLNSFQERGTTNSVLSKLKGFNPISKK